VGASARHAAETEIPRTGQGGGDGRCVSGLLPRGIPVEVGSGPGIRPAPPNVEGSTGGRHARLAGAEADGDGAERRRIDRRGVGGRGRALEVSDRGRGG